MLIAYSTSLVFAKNVILTERLPFLSA